MTLILIVILPIICAAAIYALVKKRSAKRLLLSVLLLAACALSEVVLGSLYMLEKDKIVSRPENLGSPYFEIYDSERIHSRLAEDMAVFDGKLYVGGGDYDANTGPVTVMSYDLERGEWESSAEALDDEQIKRFRVLGGELVILGTDPKGDWSMGNYYQLFDGGWETLRVLPSGIHCFDAREYGGFVFFALGVNSGDYPITRYDGKNYEMLRFYKDGELLDTSVYETIRVYNLFEFRGELFAFLTLDYVKEDGTKDYFMDLYRYVGDGFEFVSGSLPATDIPDVVVLGETACFVMNNALITSQNLTEFSAVNVGKGVRVVDIMEFEGKAYILAAQKANDSRYESMVFEVFEDGSTEKIFGFYAHNVPGSFCRDSDAFYVSMGRRGGVFDSASAGCVFRVALDDLR